jgi:pimeloyl-ACP methyl ester carboxylesterase
LARCTQLGRLRTIVDMTTHVGDPPADTRGSLLRDTPIIERRIDAAALSTAVLECGEGAPVVLLHGPGEFALGWTDLIVALSDSQHVVAPDLPGHGESETTDPLDAERVIAWLDELIAATCATPPVVVGRVLGGALAARHAAANGERISGLVLVDAMGLSPFEPAPPFGEALHRFLADPTEHSHDQLMQYCSFDFDAVRSRLGDRWTAISRYAVDRIRTPATQAAVMSMMEHVGSAIPEAVLSSIAVPTTLVWGRHDMATPLRVAEDASRAFGWPLHVIEDAADDPAMDQPEAFLTALQAAIIDGSRR